MKSLSKKLLVTLLAATAGLCVLFGLVINRQSEPSYAEESTVLTVADFEGTESGGTYTITGVKATTVTSLGSKKFAISLDNVSKINAPATGLLPAAIKGNLTEVTGLGDLVEISEGAFSGCSGLTEINLSAATNLITIGKNAFAAGGTSGVTSITIPEGVTSIGDTAFGGHTSLTTVNFNATGCADFAADASRNPFNKAGLNGNGLTVNLGSSTGTEVSKIPAYLFYANSTNANKVKKVNFVNVSISDAADVHDFGKGAFEGCSALTAVDFEPSTVGKIGESAFKDTGLTAVAISAKTKEVGKSAFQNCKALATINYLSDATPKKLEVLGSSAFSGCSALTSVVIPDTVTNVEGSVFQNCTSVTSITVGAKVYSFGTAVFSGCSKVSDITYKAVAAFAPDLTASPFANCGNEIALKVSGSSGNEIYTIGPGMFYNTNIKSVEFSNIDMIALGSGTNKFGGGAFANCKQLEEVTFYASCEIATFGEAAFSGCTQLETVTLPTSLKKVAERTFENCSSLYEITGLDAVTEIESNAFANCVSLYTFKVPATLTTVGANAFTGCEKLVEIDNRANSTLTNVYPEKSDNGNLARYALNVLNKSTDPSNISIVGTDYVVYTDGGETRLLAYIGDAAEVDLNDVTGLKQIYNGAFKANSTITKVTISDDVRTIGKSAFENCKNLVTVEFSAATQTIGEAAFAGCSALKNVNNFPAITKIAASMFENCTALTAFSVPASVSEIATSAFNGCTKLTNVEFRSGTLLATINWNAFRNCTSLRSIALPKTVSSIGSYAFSGCRSLEIVYLSDSLTSYTQAGLFDNCSDKLILIAPYDNFSSYNAYFNGYGTVTYEVEVNLVYGSYKPYEQTGDHDVVVRLHGEAYDFVKQADGTWLKGGGMPVQKNYSSSVWYEESGCVEKVDGARLTAMLGTAAPKLNLYAHYLNKATLANLAVTPNVVYNANSSHSLGNIFTTTSYAAVFTPSNPAANYTFTVTAYKLVSGVAAPVASPDLNDIKDAGTYTISVNIADTANYGEWAGSVQFEYVINPIDIDLATDSTSPLVWNATVEGGSASALSTGRLYLYGDGKEADYVDNNSGLRPYSSALSEHNYPVEIPKDVRNGFVIDANKDYLFALADNDYFTVREYNGQKIGGAELTATALGVTAKDYGIYEIECVLTASNNYRLKFTNAQKYELDWVNGAGNEYTIVKTIYIASPGNNGLVLDGKAYKLPDAPAGASADIEYGWVFGDGTTISAPTLAVTAGQETDLITFKLYSDSDAIWTQEESAAITYAYDRFTDIIHNSMPAGIYTLEVHIKAITIGSDYYPGTGDHPEIYVFEVVKAEYNDGSNKGKELLHGDLYKNNGAAEVFVVEYIYDVETTARNESVQFAPTTSVVALGKESAEIYPDRANSTFWKDAKYDKHYTEFEITYNVNGFPTYYTVSELNAKNPASKAPAARGLYTVYFNVTSPNYQSLVDTSDPAERAKYSYELYIKETIRADKIEGLSGLKYIGGEKVAIYDTDIYRFIALDGSTKDADYQADAKRAANISGSYDYAKAGEKKIAVIVRPDKQDSYRWDTTAINGSLTSYYILDFIIARAANDTTTPLSIRNWTWGEYDAVGNKPRWDTKFAHDDTKFTFSLTSTSDPTAVYYFNKANEPKFEDAPAGEYILEALTIGGEGYDWNQGHDIYRTVYISKATVKLQNVPHIPSWTYGNFANAFKAEPSFEFESKFADLNVNTYVLTSSEYAAYLSNPAVLQGITATKVSDLAKNDAYQQVPVGDYFYIATLGDDEVIGVNYEEWSYTIRFSVLITSNSWKVTPAIHDWVYGSYSQDAMNAGGEPVYGSKRSVQYTYCMVDENGNPQGSPVTLEEFEQAKLDVNGQLPVGRYMVTATHAATKNFTELSLSLYFNISKVTNNWKEDGLPKIESWSESNWNAYVNAVSANASYGKVEYSLYAASDKDRAHPLDMSKLDSLGVGSYVIVAHVAGNDNYTELTSETTFAVFEDSVGMKGLIAATMVFAAVAICLAVAGVVLLILRNRKLEKEFRMMVRSELRRK